MSESNPASFFLILFFLKTTRCASVQAAIATPMIWLIVKSRSSTYFSIRWIRACICRLPTSASSALSSRGMWKRVLYFHRASTANVRLRTRLRPFSLAYLSTSTRSSGRPIENKNSSSLLSTCSSGRPRTHAGSHSSSSNIDRHYVVHNHEEGLARLFDELVEMVIALLFQSAPCLCHQNICLVLGQVNQILIVASTQRRAGMPLRYRIIASFRCKPPVAKRIQLSALARKPWGATAWQVVELKPLRVFVGIPLPRVRLDLTSARTALAHFRTVLPFFWLAASHCTRERRLTGPSDPKQSNFYWIIAHVVQQRYDDRPSIPKGRRLS